MAKKKPSECSAANHGLEVTFWYDAETLLSSPYSTWHKPIALTLVHLSDSGIRTVGKRHG